ncbi:MAG: Asp-tRNA(Asn)/Glu-tRNA(Gln) amidotransferase subunit GatB [bacterium]|nr:Asp-tRNA(Asn)/Glu-tRNA(Gln) amidotransferase subunit GatB [bacterium]
MEYETVIGLEIHSELATRSKMFCSSPNNPEETIPNTNICPVCMGHPGTLPAANMEAVRRVIMVGHALGATIPDSSKFDRKNYFYPDLPKGYQISQYDLPLVEKGLIKISSGKDIRITRVHLEEDTASSVHDKEGNSLVDFNRAGVPLMELVTEPDMRSAQEAREAAEELQLIFQYAGASKARMDKGEMRVEANVSIRPVGTQELGTKVELKNINSFKNVEKAIEFEVERQKALLENGEKVEQQTRGWDDNKQETVMQRIKESAHDYRYFPDPDLPRLEIASIRDELKTQVPELPAAKRKRFKEQFNIDDEAIEIFVRNKELSEFYESAASELKEWLSTEGADSDGAYKLLRNYMLSDMVRALDEAGVIFGDMKMDAENLAELITLITTKKISSRGAKDLLAHMVTNGGDPTEIAKDKDIFQTTDVGALEEAVRVVIAQNEKAVKEYKEGKTNALQFMVGMTMKGMRGKGNPEAIRKILLKELGS